jgi:hypothetical protein
MIQMKPTPLTLEEIAVLDNPADIVLFEMIKGSTKQERLSFDCYRPKSMQHYMGMQRQWIEKERWLIAQRKGHGEYVDNKELMEDMLLHDNCTRFKMWYCIKYGDMVERK